MLIFWERIFLSLYFPFPDLILNKVHHHPTVPPSMIRTEAGAQLWQFKNRRGYVRFSYACQGFPCQNCWLSLFSLKAVAKQQQYSTCHWNYGQGIELLPSEQCSLIIWLNYSLLVILRVLSGSNVRMLGEISSSVTEMAQMKCTYQAKGQTPHIFSHHLDMLGKGKASFIFLVLWETMNCVNPMHVSQSLGSEEAPIYLRPACRSLDYTLNTIHQPEILTQYFQLRWCPVTKLLADCSSGFPGTIFWPHYTANEHRN